MPGSATTRRRSNAAGRPFRSWSNTATARDHHPQALTCYRRALDRCRDLCDRYLETQILICVGDTHHATHDLNAARDAWQHALTILTELDHPDAAQVRAKLTREPALTPVLD
jgi:hypothetical protein